jgi:hypothetical protein
MEVYAPKVLVVEEIPKIPDMVTSSSVVCKLPKSDESFYSSCSLFYPSPDASNQSFPSIPNARQ